MTYWDATGIASYRLVLPNEPKNSEEFSVWLSRIVWYAHTLGPYGWHGGRR